MPLKCICKRDFIMLDVISNSAMNNLKKLQHDYNNNKSVPCAKKILKINTQFNISG